MAVILVPKFSKAQIAAMMLERKTKIEDAMILALKKVGEQFIRNSRLVDTYKDQTGNLRSSKGYVILKNGEQLFSSGFKKVGSGGEGVAAGQSVIEEAKGNFPTGFVLIGVAGMDYAAAVESKGFDVLTASSKQAEEDLKAAFAKLTSRIGKMR